MAECVCMVDLKTIRHAGNYLGDDWTYTVMVNGEAREIEGNGGDQDFDPPMRWTVTGGDCGANKTVTIAVKALEDDLFFDDEGSAIKHITVACPPAGAEPARLSNEAVRARVVEAIGWFSGGTNFVDFVFDVEFRCNE